LLSLGANAILPECECHEFVDQGRVFAEYATPETFGKAGQIGAWRIVRAILIEAPYLFDGGFNDCGVAGILVFAAQIVGMTQKITANRKQQTAIIIGLPSAGKEFLQMIERIDKACRIIAHMRERLRLYLFL